MTPTLINRAIAVLIAALVAACSGSRPSPAPSPPITPQTPWSVGPVINGVNYSPGVLMQPLGDGSYAFMFPQAPPGVHYVTRAPSEQAGSFATEMISMRFAIEGSDTTRFVEVDAAEPGPGKLRLYLQRCGDDWSGGAKASYRFWSGPVDLAVGEQALMVTLTPGNWTNVFGQSDAAGFADLLGSLCNIGFTFGGQFGGHGAYATGSARFVVKEFSLH